MSVQQTKYLTAEAQNRHRGIHNLTIFNHRKVATKQILAKKDDPAIPRPESCHSWSRRLSSPSLGLHFEVILTGLASIVLNPPQVPGMRHGG